MNRRIENLSLEDQKIEELLIDIGFTRIPPRRSYQDVIDMIKKHEETLSKVDLKKFRLNFKGSHFHELLENTPLDYDKFDYILRIHEVHYLFYSFTYGRFTIGIKFEIPKGKAGGGYDKWNTIMLPKTLRTLEAVHTTLTGILPEKFILNLYA